MINDTRPSPSILHTASDQKLNGGKAWELVDTMGTSKPANNNIHGEFAGSTLQTNTIVSLNRTIQLSKRPLVPACSDK